MKSDTSKVIIPISYIKDANAKLIERIYLIKVNAEKDSIINLNKLYIKEQNVIVKDFQTRVINLTDNNNQLVKSNNRYRTTNVILKVIIITAAMVGTGIVLTN